MILLYSRCGRTMEVYKSGKAANECLINPKPCLLGLQLIIHVYGTSNDYLRQHLDLSLLLHNLMVVHSYNKVVDSDLSKYAHFYIFPH